MPPKSSATWSLGLDRRYWLSFAVLFLILLPAVTTRIYASDEVEYFVFLRSLWFDRDVSFDNDYRHVYDSGMARPPGFHETFLVRTTATGQRINFGTIGCAILWTPFYAVGDVAARAMHAMGQPVEVNGYSKPYVAAVSYASATYGALSLALAVLICRRVFGWLPDDTIRARAFLAAALVWIGTPLVFYMYVTPPMAHATSSFTAALFIYVWLRVRENWRIRNVALLAALAALMAMVREQDLLLAVGPALDYGRDLARRRHDAWHVLWKKIAVAAVAFAVVFLPQALAYLALNGRIGPSELVTRKMIWWAPHGVAVLLSPEHGFFWWTPLALVAIGGLVAMALGRVGQVGQVGRVGRVGLVGRVGQVGRSSPPDAPAPSLPLDLSDSPDLQWLGFCLLAMVAAQIYVNGSVDSWTLAGAFGQRRFVSLTPLLVVGVCAVLVSGARFAMGVALVLCVWWNLALMVQFGSGLMDRQRLQLGLNARHAFVTVPRELPRLAYRYVFDRGSFFNGPR